MHILIIEDDTETAVYLTEALRENGYVMEHAACSATNAGRCTLRR